MGWAGDSSPCSLEVAPKPCTEVSFCSDWLGDKVESHLWKQGLLTLHSEGRQGCLPQSPSRLPRGQVESFAMKCQPPPPVPSSRLWVRPGWQVASTHRRQRDPCKQRTSRQQNSDGTKPPSDRCSSGGGGLRPREPPGLPRGSHQFLPLRLPHQHGHCPVQSSSTENNEGGSTFQA